VWRTGVELVDNWVEKPTHRLWKSRREVVHNRGMFRCIALCSTPQAIDPIVNAVTSQKGIMQMPERIDKAWLVLASVENPAR
jgi:hypothetical protein